MLIGQLCCEYLYISFVFIYTICFMFGEFPTTRFIVGLGLYEGIWLAEDKSHAEMGIVKSFPHQALQHKKAH